MTVNGSQKRLDRITQVLLSTEINYKELFDVIEDFFCLLQEASQIDISSQPERADIYLPAGKAIGSAWAGLCVKDIMRTRQFVRGIFKAVENARQQFPGTRLHILYAGTGPFAALVLPLTTLFTSDELEFTLLEINTKSIELLNNTISFFGMEKYVKDIIQVDAAVFRAAEKDRPVHLIICEAMLNALQKEPQVAITLNLAPQLMAGGFFIPQNIIIDAGLLSPLKRRQNREGKIPMEECYRILKTVFQLNKDKLPQPVSDAGSQDLFSEEQVEIPHQLVQEYPELYLFTTIQVFDDISLTHWQSSLTLPQILWKLDAEWHLAGIQYCLGKNPKFLLNIKG